MSFKITIEVPDTKLAATLRQLNGHKAMVENVHDEESVVTTRKKKYKPRMHNRGDTMLTMTGKTPNVGSKLLVARELFEKLEKRKGIGAVSVADFRSELTKKGEEEHLCKRSVTEGVLAYMD